MPQNGILRILLSLTEDSEEKRKAYFIMTIKCLKIALATLVCERLYSGLSEDLGKYT